jgi:hypothetical protein
MTQEEFDQFTRSKPEVCKRDDMWVAPNPLNGEMSLYTCPNHPEKPDGTFVGYCTVVYPIKIAA